MPLFQKSVVNKYLANLDSLEVVKAYEQYNQFYGDAERIDNIRLLKEENYQEGFLREIFVDVLGYTINPNKNYNLTTEFKNLTDSKKADGAILLDGKAIGVIELKSTNTPYLESIREQAFNYKNNQTNCRFVITSNFEKLRFYIDNATDWEEFNLFNLDFENFRKFYLYLSKDSIFNGITIKLKDESKLHEEDITGKLYNDYSVFKHQLFNDLIKLNPAQDKLLLFHKSQKLLDRILFVLFAEDRGLLPPNAITRIIDQWKTLKDLDEEKSLYSRFVKLFHHLDEGHKYKEYELPAYNGGLFKKDSVLDSLIISDNILNTNTIKLSTYDYNTEVDVNILGHIFENSITEIEQVKAEIEGEQTDKNRSRRKKEGIFYTPKYITKYIVDNTVGALCNEKKKELGIDEIENEIIENSRTSKGKLSKKAEALLKKLDNYRTYLLSLKILDPACGSGAFLNQALEFLINEHELIDSYRRELEQDSLGLYDTTKSILENNLYGVDINEEAVEIAKLSLWIRTAERGRKLSNLNNNIKCGNSLIDDPAVAGDKAFDWKKEFPEIMKDGGFDIVIGNPPYIPAEKISEKEKEYFVQSYKSAYGRINIYPLFFEKGLKLCNNILGFITPYTILKNQYYIESRRYILENSNIDTIVDFSGTKVFKDAAVDSIIVILKSCETCSNQNQITYLNEIKDFENRDYSINFFYQSDISKNDDLSLVHIKNSSLMDKVFINCKYLEEVVNFDQGIITGDNKRFVTTEFINNYKKLVTGADFDRYSLHYNGLYINYDINALHRSRKPEVFENPVKILLRQTGSYPICTIDDEKYYTLDTVHNGRLIDESYDILYLLSILNSKLHRYIYQSRINEQGKVFAQVKIIYINSLPIKITDKESQKKHILLVQEILNVNKSLQKTFSTFLSRIQSNFTIDKPSNKLKEFYNYDFKNFLSELKKKKITIALKQQDEWERYFNEYKTEINKLQQQINQTDKEIDQLVYQLYGLTAEEIKIVEESTKS